MLPGVDHLESRITRPARLLSTALIAVLVLGAAGCSSTPGDQDCAARQSCNALGQQTVSECATSLDSCRKALQLTGGECSKLADSLESWLTCDSSLSCSARNAPANAPSCETELSAVETELKDGNIGNCPACDVPLWVPGSGSQSWGAP